MLANNLLEVLHDALLGSFERFGRRWSKALQNVERYLGVVDVFRQTLEGQQIDRLLMEFVEPLTSTLGCGLEYIGDYAASVAGLLHAQQKQAKHHGYGLAEPWLQIHGNALYKLAIEPWRTDAGTRLVL